MQHPRNVEFTAKINNCIDDLLMQDTTFNQQIQKQSNKNSSQNPLHYQQSITNKKNQKSTRKQKQIQYKNESEQMLVVSKNSKSTLTQQKKIPSSRRKLRQQVNNKLRQQANLSHHYEQHHNINLFSSNNKQIQQQRKIIQTSRKKQLKTESNQQQLTNKRVNLGNKSGQQLQLKKTYSYQVKGDQDDRANNSLISNELQSPQGLLIQSTIGNDNNLLLTTTSIIAKDNYHNKALSINATQTISRSSILNRKRLQFIKQSNNENQQYQHNYNDNRKPSKPSPHKQFKLTRQQLQFLSLLYPNQSPQQLMLKLLSYYQQQQQYNNSFQQLFQQYQSNQQFFTTTHQIHLKIPNTIFQSSPLFNCQHQEFVKCSSKDNNKNINGNNNYHNLSTKNTYSKLKQQCLAALGQQMVQTQIKTELAQTANVNYYTRQYAMPIIMETLNQKNHQAHSKLSKLQQTIKNHQQFIRTQQLQQIPLTSNQQKIAAALAQTNQSLNSQIGKIPSQFIHKVYIPANSRGQAFQMDYKPDSKLFQYITQNDYRRILRDINHLIQKVLSYHRHSSFLKKKNNSLLKGWNLALLIFLFIVIVMLYTRLFLVIQSGYFDIIVFFCLSLIVILILGNSFNNYKKNVKRTSVIKQISQQVTSYLDFVNSSNKNIKWVLGKDFFWLQIWIDVIKNNYRHIK